LTGFESFAIFFESFVAAWGQSLLKELGFEPFASYPHPVEQSNLIACLCQVGK